MTAFNRPANEILTELGSNETTGLTSEEAKKRLAEHGENKLKGKKKKSFFVRFLEQFKDVMIICLIVAAIVSFVVATRGDDPMEFLEPALIIGIVILNALIGVVQESRAEKALDALQNLSAPHTRVIRDGVEKIIDACEVVVGDIIKLEAGDSIPADARLLRSVSLKCEESALTGESVPSDKNADAIVDENAPLGDRVNMIYSGCSVSYGTALAVVVGTGMNTEMGKIANLLESAGETKTPLQEKLAQLGKYLGFVALGACAVIFVIGLINKLEPLDIFMTAVSLAVSAIPEGLPAIVTVVLSIGVQRMVKKNAIIRRLPAVETLGSASVICSDKTGTLTQNRMTLVRTYCDGEEAKQFNFADEQDEKTKNLLRLSVLCCDGSVTVEDGKEKHIGDPTETALVLAGMRIGMPKEALNAESPRVAELPFDSDRKLMTSVNKVGEKYLVVTKGAFDCLVPRCVSGDLVTAKEQTEKMSSDALRVLAVAYKYVDELPTEPTSDSLENGLTFAGLVAMIDPPRPEARDAVAVCRRAGIKPVMITGDHVVTASAIAKDLGILTDGDRAITGAELDAMSDEELDREVEHIAVYARVSPENKIRIVRAWQRKGQVVSMTGDGVNDAPALKAADIGCAMGITGTDVAKGAADMTLTDDNFATIVDAVREGRGIYANIKKVVGYLLGTNIGEILTVFFAMILWHKTPLLSMQLLWINLITDSLPAISLGMEAVDRDIMNQKPKPKSEGIFAHGFGLQTVLQGVMFGLLSLTAFFVGHQLGGTDAYGQTMAFIVLGFSQIVQSFNMRSEHSLFKIGFFTNKKLNLSALLSIVLSAVILFTPARIAFGLEILTPAMYGISAGLVFMPLLVMEIVKLIRHGVRKKQA